MKDLYLLFCIISLFVGVSSISISLFCHTTHPKIALKFFIGFNLSLFAIQNALTLGIYSKYMVQVSPFVGFLQRFLDLIGTSFSSLLGLFFIHCLFGVNLSKVKKILFLSIFLFQFVGIGVYYIFNTPTLLSFLIRFSIIATIVYGLLIGIKNYKHIAHKDLRNAIKSFILITLFFLPFIALEAYKPYIAFAKDLDVLKILALPCYFLTINIFSLVLVIKYFNKPAFIESNNLTPYFKETYELTEKQSEIIELVLKGMTYKQIAEQLFISPKTVDNHMQNIYKKLNVNSKMQLSHLILSNKK